MFKDSYDVLSKWNVGMIKIWYNLVDVAVMEMFLIIMYDLSGKRMSRVTVTSGIAQWRSLATLVEGHKGEQMTNYTPERKSGGCTGINLSVCLPICLSICPSVQIRVRPITIFALTLALHVWHMGLSTWKDVSRTFMIPIRRWPLT